MTIPHVAYSGGTTEKFPPPERRCPSCGVFAICALPPLMLAKQPDDTTHVCHPRYGGCNAGFELEESIVVTIGDNAPIQVPL